MVDALNPAKVLLFAWLLLSSLSLGCRLARRFVSVTEPLDIAGYSLAFSMLTLGSAGSLLARLTHSLPLTFCLLAAAMSVPLLQDLRSYWRRRRSPPGLQPRSAPSTFLSADFPSPFSARGVLNSRERLLAAALGVAILFPPLSMIWRTHIWDDWYAHLPMVSTLSRGILPLVEPFLPDRLLTYHYGHNWLAAVLEYHTGLSPEHGVDVISTAMLVTFFLAGAATFRLWVGGRFAPYVAASAMIGFGSLSWIWALLKVTSDRETTFFFSWARKSYTGFSHGFATSADYLLQKPMLAGTSLLWTVLAVLFVARKRISVAGAAAAGICVGMLELFNFPTALLVGAASGAVLLLDVVTDRPARRNRLLMLVAFGVTAMIVTRTNGGFVANPQKVPVALERVWNFPFDLTTQFARANDLSTLACYLLYFGISLFALPLVAPALWRRNRHYIVWFAVFFLCGFALPHLYRHRHSPGDITKFIHLSSFAIAALTAAGVTATTAAWPRFARRTVLGLFLIVGSLSTWLVSYQASGPGGAVDGATVSSLRRMARWLRANAQTYDRVFSLSDDVTAMSGILSPLPPYAPGDRQVYKLKTYGYPLGYLDALKTATTGLANHLDDPTLRRLGIRWVALPYPFPDTVGAEARRRLGEAEVFRLRHQTAAAPGGSWRIYEYLKRPVERPAEQ